MNIRILQLIEGAQAAKGLTVIIDVFRAYTVELYLMRNHAARIIPVADVQFAFDYKAAHPDAILCGERKGRIIDGFDYGNSPSQLEKVDLTGKTVIHTTSAGTQGVANAIHAEEIIGGSLVCAKAIARYILQKNPEEVSLVCMGLAGKTPTDEDTLCAEYIKSLLDGKPLTNMRERIEKLKTTSGAKFFDPEKQEVFPERDFHLCTQVDRSPFILRLVKDPGTGLDSMERVDVMGIPYEDFHEAAGEPPVVRPGDMLSRFTREQVSAFSPADKARLVYGKYTAPQGDFDAVLVLGGPDSLIEARAKAAARLYLEGRTKLLIPTGGVFWDSPFGCRSEAEILAGYLMAMGVPKECILLEEQATTTPENMRYCARLLRERFGQRRVRLAVATSYYHVVRSVSLAKASMPGVEIVGVRAEDPLDNPGEFMQSYAIRQWVNKECFLLWSYVNKGYIADIQL